MPLDFAEQGIYSYAPQPFVRSFTRVEFWSCWAWATARKIISTSPWIPFPGISPETMVAAVIGRPVVGTKQIRVFRRHVLDSSMNNTLKSVANISNRLVSIICRSIGRQELADTLASIARQTYSPIDVILVDASGSGFKPTDTAIAGLNIKIVSTGRRLSRSQAANAGLEKASGDYLMFLDDDDWIDEHHVAILVESLASQESIRAVYSNVAMVTPDGEETGEIFDHDYDPVLLRRDNYIPIHAVLFCRSLLDSGCCFDESLNIYEDWDFWLQLSRLTDFIHVDTVTAFYRRGGASETAFSDYRLRYQPGHPIADARARLLGKWAKIWSGQELNELLGIMDDITLQTRLRMDIAKAERHIADIQKVLNDQQTIISRKETVISEKEVQIKLLNNAMEYSRQSSERQIAALNQKVAQTEASYEKTKRQFNQTRWHMEQHIAELEERINEIYASFSWRIMGPYRRLARLLDDRIIFPLKQRVHFKRYGTRLERTSSLQKPATPRQTAEHRIVENPEALKKQYKQKAEQNLRDFLHNSPGIDFPEVATPTVSILLVLYNQAPLTLLCLESILQFAPYPYQVVVIDNASSDQTTQLMEKIRHVTRLRNEDNVGFVRAVNQGVELCRGKYTLLLNNDAILHKGSIEAALRTLENDPQAGAVGGRILLLDGLLQEAGSFIFSDGSCLGYGRHQPPESPEYMFRRPVDYCSGAFLLFATDLFKDLGGFDDDYAPAYYEDSDFCVRLQEKGLKVIYEPFAVITHYEFASSGGQTQASELQTRHRSILCQKHAQYLATRVAPHQDKLLKARIANNHINVLLIDDRVPHTNLGSGFPRCKQIARILAEAQVNLCFYPLQFPSETWADVYQTLPANVEVMLNLTAQGLEKFLFSRKDYFDYIFISRIHNMEAFGAVVRKNPSVIGTSKIIYDAEAVTALRTIMYRELMGHAVSEADKQKMIREEITFAYLADTVIAVSDQEAKIYHDHGLNNTAILGHSLQTVPTTRDFAERSDLLFVGALQFENSPNVDSLQWFAENILPSLKEVIPELKLIVVGDSSAPSLKHIPQQGIEFVGRIEDTTPYYERCRIFVAPTRFAAGIPHKVHEAAARGVPCVTTSLLAQQLGWKSGTELLAADSVKDFIAACLDLYRDAALWHKLRGNALAAVERQCAPEKFASDLLTLFELPR